MSDLLNPYTPPSIEPSAPRMEVPDGSLWRVEDGRLLVRNYASLPDVCIHGSPPEEPGGRKSLVFRNRRPWVFLLLVSIVGIASVTDPDAFRMSLLLMGALNEAAAQRVRVMVFEATGTAARRLFRWAFAFVAFMVLVSAVFRGGWNFDAVGEAVAFAVLYLGAYAAFYFFGRRARRQGKGWFELKGIAPAAIARLAEIQQQTVIRQDDIRERRKR
jgi:hypothetical protein